MTAINDLYGRPPKPQPLFRSPPHGVCEVCGAVAWVDKGRLCHHHLQVETGARTTVPVKDFPDDREVVDGMMF